MSKPVAKIFNEVDLEHEGEESHVRGRHETRDQGQDNDTVMSLSKRFKTLSLTLPTRRQHLSELEVVKEESDPSGCERDHSFSASRSRGRSGSYAKRGSVGGSGPGSALALKGSATTGSSMSTATLKSKSYASSHGASGTATLTIEDLATAASP